MDREEDTRAARWAVALGMAAATAILAVWVVPRLERGWADRGAAIPMWAVPLVRGAALVRLAWVPLGVALGLWVYLGAPRGPGRRGD